MISASQAKVQKYMEQQNIQPLLEDLMSHLIKDQPQEPTIYLMKVLQKKAESKGIHVPLQVKIDTGFDRMRSMSPKKREQDIRGGGDASRSYSRPWMSNAPPVSRSRQRLLSGDRKNKGGQSASGGLDDIWSQGNRRSTSEFKRDATASSSHQKLSSSTKRIQPVSINYSGPGYACDEEDPLASELPVVADDNDMNDQLQTVTKTPQRGKHLGNHMSSLKKAREEQILKKLSLQEERKNKADHTEFTDPRLEDKENSHIYVIEDNETLMAEGVSMGNPNSNQQMSAVYSTAKSNQHKEIVPSAQVKVSICQNCAKIFTASRGNRMDSVDDILSDTSRSDTAKNINRPFSSRSIGSDIESASQVDGPRPLKWSQNINSSRSRTHANLPSSAAKEKTTHLLKSSTKKSQPTMKGRGWDIPASPKSFLDDDEMGLEISARSLMSKDETKY